MDAVRTAARRDALRAVAAERGLDAVLVTNLLNVRYLTGFTGSNGALLVRTDGADLFGTDGRYTTQAGIQVPDVELLVDRATVAGLAREAVRRGGGGAGFEAPHPALGGPGNPGGGVAAGAPRGGGPPPGAGPGGGGGPR